ncbi:MAG: type II toxin-antitoxin system VapC family toxin [Gemmatimonadaceae bacterium]
MARRERKYTLDTNLYVRAFRDPATNAELQLFHTAFAPFEYLSAIVVQELRAGARGGQTTDLERHVFAPFERRGRLLTPSYAAWNESGRVLTDLVERSRLEWRSISRGFVNDVLLAMTCREARVTLVTDNRRDFERIARVRSFDFAEPWPVPAS